MPANPVAVLAQSLSQIAGAPVELERPGDPEHGDYATNVALRMAPVRKQAPRDLAAEIADAALAGGVVESAEPAGPGFVNLRVSDAWLAGAVAEILSGGGRLRRVVDRRPARARPGRDGLRQPDRAAHRRPRSERRVRRLGRTAPRARRARGRARVLLQRRRRARWSGSTRRSTRFDAARSRPRTATAGSTSHELAALPGDPVPPMLAQIEATLERFRIHFDTWALESEVEAEIPEAIALLDTFEAEGAVWAADERARRRQGSGRDPLGRHPRRTSPRTRRTCGASTRAASTG